MTTPTPSRGRLIDMRNIHPMTIDGRPVEVQIAVDDFALAQVFARRALDNGGYVSVQDGAITVKVRSQTRPRFVRHKRLAR